MYNYVYIYIYMCVYMLRFKQGVAPDHFSFDLKSQIWYKQTSQSIPKSDLFKKHRKNATSSPPPQAHPVALQIPVPGHRRPEGTIELLLDLAARFMAKTMGGSSPTSKSGLFSAEDPTKSWIILDHDLRSSWII